MTDFWGDFWVAPLTVTILLIVIDAAEFHLKNVGLAFLFGTDWLYMFLIRFSVFSVVGLMLFTPCHAVPSQEAHMPIAVIAGATACFLGLDGLRFLPNVFRSLTKQDEAAHILESGVSRLKEIIDELKGNIVAGQGERATRHRREADRRLADKLATKYQHQPEIILQALSRVVEEQRIERHGEDDPRVTEAVAYLSEVLESQRATSSSVAVTTDAGHGVVGESARRLVELDRREAQRLARGRVLHTPPQPRS